MGITLSGLKSRRSSSTSADGDVSCGGGLVNCVSRFGWSVCLDLVELPHNTTQTTMSDTASTEAQAEQPRKRWRWRRRGQREWRGCVAKAAAVVAAKTKVEAEAVAVEAAKTEAEAEAEPEAAKTEAEAVEVAKTDPEAVEAAAEPEAAPEARETEAAAAEAAPEAETTAVSEAVARARHNHRLDMAERRAEFRAKAAEYRAKAFARLSPEEQQEVGSASKIGWEEDEAEEFDDEGEYEFTSAAADLRMMQRSIERDVPRSENCEVCASQDRETLENPWYYCDSCVCGSCGEDAWMCAFCDQ